MEVDLLLLTNAAGLVFALLACKGRHTVRFKNLSRYVTGGGRFCTLHNSVQEFGASTLHYYFCTKYRQRRYNVIISLTNNLIAE